MSRNRRRKKERLRGDDSAIPALPLPVGGKLIRTLGRPGRLPTGLAFDPTGTSLVCGYLDGTLEIRHPESRRLLSAPSHHENGLLCVAVSPKGHEIACGDVEGILTIHESSNGARLRTIKTNQGVLFDISFDPSGRKIASAGGDGTIRIWEGSNGKLLQTIERQDGAATSVAFDRIGRILASGSFGGRTRLWHVVGGHLLHTLHGHGELVNSVAFHPSGRLLATASHDTTVKIWNVENGKLVHTLEGHEINVSTVRFSPDGQVLASRSVDGIIRLWNCDSWETVGVIAAGIDERIRIYAPYQRPLAFHPRLPLLATIGFLGQSKNDQSSGPIQLWELDHAILLGKRDSLPSESRAKHHATAKIVLVGDSGVGKTGLGWRLAHEEYREHDSTHGQQFWVLNPLAKTRSDGTECEAVLWDLAGQPDYRLIHALSIQDADLALILFDPTNSRDPLGSAEYWLRQLPPTCPKILIAARVDRGHPVLSNAELDDFCKRQGIAGGWIATSAASGLGLDELLERMKRAIPWDEKPSVTTDAVFKRIKDFVLSLKESNTRQGIIYAAAELRGFLEDHKQRNEELPSIRQKTPSFVPIDGITDDQVVTAVRHLSSEGFVRLLTLSTGEQRVLLVPELLNNLAASVVLEARRNPRGLGAVEESRLFDNSYRFRELESLSPADQALLLDGTITAFLENRLSYRCFRESFGPTRLLIFPDLMNLKKPDREDLVTEEGPSYILTGSTENTFAGLVVLLGYTNLFLRTDQAQDVAWFESDRNELCGVRQFRDNDERTLVVLFGQNASPQIRSIFQGLVEQVLSQRDIHVRRLRPAQCSNCQTYVERVVVSKWLKKGKSSVHCAECGQIVVLPPDEPLAVQPAERARIRQESAIAELRTRFEEVIYELQRLVLAEKRHAPLCFVSYAWDEAEHDRWVERRLALDLEKAGITVVLDRWDNAHPAADKDRFLDRIRKADHILVVGTPSYPRKYLNADPTTGTAVAAEVSLIAARMSEQTRRLSTVVPLLLSGASQGSLPPELQSGEPFDFRNNEHYFDVALDLILKLYGIEPEHPAVSHWKQKLAGDAWESRLIWHALESDEEDEGPTDEFTLKNALRQVGRRSLQASFEAGRPVVVEQHGELVWLHPDGTTRPYNDRAEADAGAG